MALTLKQEKFCQELMACGNQSEAYRRAYNTAGTAKTIGEQASRVANSPGVAARLVELKEEVRSRYSITIDDIIEELEEARIISKVDRVGSTMVSATMGKAKVLGMIVDRKEISVHGIISSMNDAELEAFIDEVDVCSDEYEDS